MSKLARRLLAFLLVSGSLAAGGARAADLPFEPPVASDSGPPANQSILPMTPSPIADPTAPLLTGQSSAQAGTMDVSRVAEPGYLDGTGATYEDGLLHVSSAGEPIILTGSSASLRVVCAPGTALLLQSLDLTGHSDQPLISWEQPAEATITFSGTCRIENASGDCLYSPGSLTLSPIDPDADSLSLVAGATCVRADAATSLTGALSLSGRTGVQAGSAHLGNGPDGTSIQLTAQSDGIQTAGDALLEGVANIVAGQSAVQAAGNVTVLNAFMNLSASSIGVQAGGVITLGSSTVFAGPLLNLQGATAPLDGEMATQGAYEISNLDANSTYTIQEARSTWGSGRELTDVRPAPDGTLRYYTLGSAGSEGRRYAVSVDEATHTIAFESLSQAYVIDLGTVLLQSSSLPDGVSLETGEGGATLRIANPEAQITLTGDGSGIQVVVDAAQSVMLNSARLTATQGSALVFSGPDETDLVLRESSSIHAEEGQSAISLGGTTLRIVQSGGAGRLSISGAGRGIAALSPQGTQDVHVEGGEVRVETDGPALAIGGTLLVTGGETRLESASAACAAEVMRLRVRGGRLSATGRGADATGIRASATELSGGIICATGIQKGLWTGTISQQSCVLNTQTLQDGGFALQVEGSDGNALDGRVLVANTLRPPGLSGAMITSGPHLVGSLEPGATYELRDETQVQPITLGDVRANANGEVVYYSSESGIYALVFGNQITLVNESAYVEQTLTDPATGISVSGTIPFTAQLSVLPLEGEELAAMQLAAGRNAIAFPVDIQLVQEGQAASFEGSLTITFPVGSEHDGETLNVIHILPRLAGAQELERIPAVVEDGTLSIQCAALSPFAVQLLTLRAETEPPTSTPEPQDGPEMSVGVFWLLIALCAGMGTWGIIVLRKHMRRRREDGLDSATSKPDGSKKGDDKDGSI